MTITCVYSKALAMSMSSTWGQQGVFEVSN